MATPGQLISTVANVLGVPEATVTSYYRTLREAELVAKAGRGRGSVKSTPQDAASLLTALCASSLIKDAARIVQDYCTLPLAQLSMGGRSYHGVIVAVSPALDSLSFKHTFGEALASLIQAAADGSLRKDRFTPGRGDQFIEVTFYGPFQPLAAIHVQTNEFKGKIYYEQSLCLGEDDQNPDEGGLYDEGEELRAQEDLNKFSKEVRETHGDGDLRQTRKFFDRTIFAVGEALKI